MCCRYFSDGKFAEISDPTVGVDFFSRLVNLDCGARVKLQLWDTAGQERFRSITKSYYRNSVGGVLAYDVCNMESFKHIPVWLQEARRHIEPHQATFILVGCKADLAVGNHREVTTEMGQVLYFVMMTTLLENNSMFSRTLRITTRFPSLRPRLSWVSTWRKRSL